MNRISLTQIANERWPLQLDSTIGDFTANREKLLAACRAAANGELK